MENISRFDMSPLSSKFQARAMNNMAAQMNTVRTQDETSPEDEAHDARVLARDCVTCSDAAMVTAEEGTVAGSAGGQLSDLADEWHEDDSEKIEESRRRGHHGSTEKLEKENPTLHIEKSVDADAERDPSREANDRLAQLRGDVPDEIWSASASMVENQMVGQAPRPALLELKSIPEPAQLEMGHADYATELMDITDRQTGPLPASVEAA